MAGLFEKIVGVLIAIVFLMVFSGAFFAGDESQFSRLRNITQGAITTVNDTFGAQELGADTVVLREGTTRQYNELLNAIRTTATTQVGACFTPFSGISERDDQASRIVFSRSLEQRGTFVQIYAGAGADQLAETLFLEEAFPCVVGGSSSAVDSFYDNFLAWDEQEKIESSPYVGDPDSFNGLPLSNQFISLVRAVEITSNGDISWIDISGNEVSREFEPENGFLYGPSEKFFCFIPTRDGNWNCGSSGSYLDDDCVQSYEKDSIPYRYDNNLLLSCTQGVAVGDVFVSEEARNNLVYRDQRPPDIVCESNPGLEACNG